ncbi:MAG: TetR/AcrR family transcriptional regulator [Euryarchaeota archaeon]|nr:TetR/AcrR family transcriptional regulator [Euryarchaeota archaeon]
MTLVIILGDVDLSLREKKKRETKNRIFEVASRLFKEKGFEKTTVDEITKEAGIAKGTFFNYFPTKVALLGYFAEQKDELIGNLIKEEITKDIPTKEKIKNVLIHLAKSNEEDKELAKIMVFEYIKNAWKRPSHPTGRGARFASVMIHLLQEGVEKGDVRGIDIQDAAENLTAIYFHSLILWLRSETDYSFSEDISKKVDMVFDGIGGSKS